MCVFKLGTYVLYWNRNYYILKFIGISGLSEVENL